MSDVTIHRDRLFVLNLAFEATDHDLAAHFDPSGRVTRAKVIVDRETGASRGFGFVSFATHADAEAAREALDGSELLGRRIAVAYAEKRTPQGQAREATGHPRRGPSWP